MLEFFLAIMLSILSGGSTPTPSNTTETVITQTQADADTGGEDGIIVPPKK